MTIPWPRPRQRAVPLLPAAASSATKIPTDVRAALSAQTTSPRCGAVDLFAAAPPAPFPRCGLVRSDMLCPSSTATAHGRSADATGVPPTLSLRGEEFPPSPSKGLPRRRRPRGRSTATFPASSIAAARRGSVVLMKRPVHKNSATPTEGTKMRRRAQEAGPRVADILRIGYFMKL